MKFATKTINRPEEISTTPAWHNKRARVSLTLRLICEYLLRSLLPFLRCIYDTLLDLEIYKIRVSSGIGFFKKKSVPVDAVNEPFAIGDWLDLD